MLKFFILIFFIFTTNSYSEVVKKIEVEGNSRISLETIKVYGEINLNSDYSSLDLNNILKNLYSTDFFEDIKVNLNNGTLKISVKEYPVINIIEIQNEKSEKIKKGILESIRLKEKSSFIKSYLNEDIEFIKKLYASQGYNFVGIDAKIEKFSENRINLIYSIDKGAQTSIAKINFIGDKKVKSKRLREIIVSEEDKFWKFLTKNTNLNYNNIELDKRLLTNYYKSNGYYDVQIVSSNAEISNDNITTLTYNINAGTRYRVNKITTNVNEVLDKKLFFPLEKDFKKIIKKYYSPFKIKKLLDELDNIIVENDLQFVEHSVNEIIENEFIEVKINIYEGSKQLVEKINVKGNSITNESVIRSELILDEGEPFNFLKLEKSISNLKARNIFADVKKEVKDGSIKDQKVIEIKVEEKPTGEISAGAGVGTNGGSFAFDVSENNYLGKGLRVSTNVEVNQSTLKGSLNVIDPNYNYTGNSLRYSLSRTTNDKADSGYENELIETSVGTSFEQYRNIFVIPSLSFSYDDLKVQDNASDALKKQKGAFSDLALDYAVQFDSRDRSFMPTDGYVSTFNQVFPLYADSPYLKNTYSLNKYHSFGPNVIGAFKFFGSAINGVGGDDVRLSKRITVSTNRLRGFQSGKIGPVDGNDYIGGNYATVANIEANLPNILPEFTKTDIGLFLDIGNLWGVDYSSSADDGYKIRASTGINTSWTSPIGPMTFVFSQNLSAKGTDKTESFNFKLGTSF